jgi:ABC-type transporter Mla MlaB component
MGNDEGTAVLVLTGPIARGDIRRVCDRARTLLMRTGADPLVCDVRGLETPDDGAIEALARVQLTARRLGRGVRFRGAGAPLREVLELLGLSDVLDVDPASVVRARRKAEQREQTLGVQEEADPGDPAA